VNIKSWVAVGTVGVLSCTTAGPVTACDCARAAVDAPLTPYKAIFLGTVRSAVFPAPEKSLDKLVEFSVERVWKGERAPRISLIEGASTCEFRFVVGERYVVAAESGGKRSVKGTRGLRVLICGHTAKVDEAAALVERLDRELDGWTPSPEPPPASGAAAHASGDGALWSRPVNGLRARLLVMPAEEPASPFCRVFIEMQNVDDVVGQKRIRFTPRQLDLHVTKSGGEQLSLAGGAYSALEPFWEPTLLPYRGTIRFQISFPGLGHRATDKVIVDIGESRTWIVPQDGSTYWLSGSLSIGRLKSDHPITDWVGTLDLPSVEIPKAR
jgi:hypothetical protein